MKALGETEYQSQVSQLARRLGYKVVHHRAGKSKAGRWSTPTTERGWPDLTLVRPPRLLFAELKGPDTPVTPEQPPFLEQLRQCGQEAYLWRSGTTTLQTIGEVLARRHPEPGGWSDA